MSDLKELAWHVQTTVDDVDFARLVRRGRRRKLRNRALAGTTVGLMIATAALSTGTAMPWQDELSSPAGQSGMGSPITLRPGRDIAHDPGAELRQFFQLASGRWVALWESCTLSHGCQRTVASKQDGSVAFTTGTVDFPHLGSVSGTVFGYRVSENPAEAPKLIVVTSDGPVERDLAVQAATERFDDELIVAGFRGNGPAVFDLSHSSARPLTMPSGLEKMKERPVRDSSGRWWVLTADGPSYVAWTDDGGSSWERHLLENGPAYVGGVSVSPNGQTVLVHSFHRDGTGVLQLSHDRGRTWSTVDGNPWTAEGSMVAFDDGTALMLGRGPGIREDQPQRLYRIGTDGKVAQVSGAPAGLSTLAGTGSQLSGLVTEEGARSETLRVAVSKDAGKSWQTFEPR
jgi:hypothetical protein